MMAYKILISLVGVLCHDFATFGYLLFTKQYIAVSQAVLDSFGVNFIPNCRKSSPNIYGFCLWRGMGYGLLWLYGFWSTFPWKSTQWIQKCMEFKGVWGMWAMGYEGVDCIHLSDGYPRIWKKNKTTVDSLVTHGSHTPYSLKSHRIFCPPSWFAGKSTS